MKTLTRVQVFESAMWHQYLPTRRGLENLCLRFGLEFTDCHRALMVNDIVGAGGRALVDSYRPVGVLFRYFETHADRLAEFQSRLDAAKHKAQRRKT